MAGLINLVLAQTSSVMLFCYDGAVVDVGPNILYDVITMRLFFVWD